MKKIVFFIFLFVIPAFADNMCVKNYSFVSILSKSRDGVSYETVPAEHKWIVQLDYVASTTPEDSSHNALRDPSTIYGYGACSETPGTESVADSAVDPSLDGTGMHCWCRLNAPLVSDWVYYGSFANDNACASGCIGACGENVKSNQEFRSAMFDSIW